MSFILREWWLVKSAPTSWPFEQSLHVTRRVLALLLRFLHEATDTIVGALVSIQCCWLSSFLMVSTLRQHFSHSQQPQSSLKCQAQRSQHDSSCSGWHYYSVKQTREST